MSYLFIPAKIRVGFQNREDTYTGRLAYVIYYDAKGVLRKEKSWKQWRDDKIDPEEFDNTPQDGFFLNKDIERYNWSHFGSNRSYIRIYDSRGIEFEVTPENLIGILTETNCLKRGLDGKFVYAWCGTELVLLPCSSQAYQDAIQYTARQGKKISARDLKPGCSYTTKVGDQVIYIGRFNWFVWSWYKDKGRTCKKKHIFTNPGKSKYGFFPKDNAAFLAELDSEEPVQDYAKIVDEFNADVHSSVLEKWTKRTLKLNPEKIFAVRKDGYNGRPYLNRSLYAEMNGDTVTFWRLKVVVKKWDDPTITGYQWESTGTLCTKQLVYVKDQLYSDYSSYDFRHKEPPLLSREQILDKLKGCVEVYAVLSSGKKLHLDDINVVMRD